MSFFEEIKGYTDYQKEKVSNTYESRKEELIKLLETHIDFLNGVEKEYKPSQKEVTTYKDGKIIIGIKLSNRLVKINDNKKNSVDFNGTPEEIKDKKVSLISSFIDDIKGDSTMAKASLEAFVTEYSNYISNKKPPTRKKKDNTE